MKSILLFLLLFLSGLCYSQSYYFPPLSGSTWETSSVESLGWCQPKVDSLYAYLERKNTKSFILLKDGKIVLEHYFGAFSADSFHYWASAGKSLTSMLCGIGIENSYFGIDDTVSNIIGDGWSSATLAQEHQITVKHLLTMTSGLDDSPTLPCDNESDTSTCLFYLADPNTRWAYHTGAYHKLEDVMVAAGGSTYNAITRNKIANKIGMTGFWLDGVYYSRTRDAARFGLLTLAKCIWNGDTILHDRTYYNAMTNTSQAFNLSYGYLWWLNGKASYMAPGISTVINSPFMPNAPDDMFCALGKNDQKIYIVPSQNMVVVRFGDSADDVASAFSPFDNDLWGKIKDLSCGTGIEGLNPEKYAVYPNPFNHKINISGLSKNDKCILYTSDGRLIYEGNELEQQDFSTLAKGLYLLTIHASDRKEYFKLSK